MVRRILFFSCQTKAVIKRLGATVQIYKGGYFISFEHPNNDRWAAKLEELGVLVRTYSSETSILRCGVPKNEADWLRLGKAINALDA